MDFSGHSDIVLPKYKAIIFVNGYFWHMHNCKDFLLPKLTWNIGDLKLEQNKARYLKNIGELQSKSWNVVIIWECELKTATDRKVKNGMPYTRMKSQKP